MREKTSISHLGRYIGVRVQTSNYSLSHGKTRTHARTLKHARTRRTQQMTKTHSEDSISNHIRFHNIKLPKNISLRYKIFSHFILYSNTLWHVPHNSLLQSASNTRSRYSRYPFKNFSLTFSQVTSRQLISGDLWATSY